MMDRSDYETNSEYDPDFDSDVEPPVDKLQEKKLYHKSASLRLYKRIIKLPKKSLELPAKYDRVNIRFLEMANEELDPSKISDEAVKEWQLGVTDLDEAVELGICSMKQGEISIFEVEEVYVDSSRSRKLGDRWYFMVELVGFVTIVDIFADFSIFKMTEHRGSGINRLEPCDLIQADLVLKSNSDEILWQANLGEKYTHVLGIANLLEIELKKFDVDFSNETLLSMLKTFKLKERAILEIPTTKKTSREPLNPTTAITINNLTYSLLKDHVYLIFEVKELLHHEDMFNDQQVVKTVLKTGYTTAKPEEYSRIFFDYSIRINDAQIFTSNLISVQGRFARPITQPN
jgi:hypothetical protein